LQRFSLSAPLLELIADAGNVSAMSAESELRPIPWWNLATTALLAVALAFAIRADRTIEAFVVGALMLPSLFLLGAWLYARARSGR